MQSQSRYRLVQLANGVHSVHSLAHDETFHPVIGPVAGASGPARAPGMLESHYAPGARVEVLDAAAVAAWTPLKISAKPGLATSGTTSAIAPGELHLRLERRATDWACMALYGVLAQRICSRSSAHAGMELKRCMKQCAQIGRAHV